MPKPGRVFKWNQKQKINSSQHENNSNLELPDKDFKGVIIKTFQQVIINMLEIKIQRLLTSKVSLRKEIKV